MVKHICNYIVVLMLTLNFQTSTLIAQNELIVSEQSNFNQKNELQNKIKQGLLKEQEIRKAFGASVRSGKINMALNNEMIKIDSINQIYLHKYLKQYGFPRLSSEGKEICDAAFYILQHGELESMKKYLPDLKEKAFKGEASKIHFAMMQDRILMLEGKKQLFGTQVSPRKDDKGYNTNVFFIWPISNPQKVNKRRKNIGFKQTIEEYAEKMKAEYDPNDELNQKGF